MSIIPQYCCQNLGSLCTSAKGKYGDRVTEEKEWLYYCVTHCNGNVYSESHLCTEMHWRHECPEELGHRLSPNVGIGPQHLRRWQQKLIGIINADHGNLFVEADSQHWLLYSQQDTESAWLTDQDPRGSPGDQPYQRPSLSPFTWIRLQLHHIFTTRIFKNIAHSNYHYKW